MIIGKLHLSHFRSFREREIDFSEKTSIIVGPNASGKTNILESIFLLATGKSFRARIEEEMISYNKEIARIAGIVTSRKDHTTGESSQAGEYKSSNRATSDKLQSTRLEIVLTRGEITLGDSNVEKTPRKKLLVNGVPRRLIDFAGNFKVVLFGPWDLDLVTESPSLRRKFLDTVLSQVDREYRRASLSYEKGLRQRNRLLYRIREEGISRGQLLFWDRLLVKNGDYIARRREEFINFVNSTPKLQDTNYQLFYDKSAISETRLEQYKDEEVAAASTLVGPHRDDFIFKVKGKRQVVKERELARYGSRGEQRMGVLWLKLAELAFIKSVTNEKPTLLLDDIFSELDHEHRDVVKDIVNNFSGQTIITTADPHFVENIKKVEKIELE